MERKKYHYTGGYTKDSVARKLNPQREQEQTRRPQIVEQPKPKQKERIGQEIDLFSAFFLVGAIAATLFICMTFLAAQSDVIQMNKSITSLESKITSLNKENNALEAEMENEMMDLEYVYQIAVGVLGMVYPNNNEVIYYNNESEGYFRQYQDIPQ